MIHSANETAQLAQHDLNNVPSQSEVTQDLTRRLKVLKSGEHRLSQYGQPLTGVYVEAAIWVAAAALVWIVTVNFLV